MGGVGDLGRAIGDGIGGLVGHAFGALAAAYDSIAATFQSILPGPTLPIVLVGAVLIVGWLVLRR